MLQLWGIKQIEILKISNRCLISLMRSLLGAIDLSVKTAITIWASNSTCLIKSPSATANQRPSKMVLALCIYMLNGYGLVLHTNYNAEAFFFSLCDGLQFAFGRPAFGWYDGFKTFIYLISSSTSQSFSFSTGYIVFAYKFTMHQLNKIWSTRYTDQHYMNAQQPMHEHMETLWDQTPYNCKFWFLDWLHHPYHHLGHKTWIDWVVNCA